MRTFVKPGLSLDFVNTSGALIAVGAGVLIGVRLGVAMGDIPNNAAGTVLVQGVVTMPKLTTDVVAQGALLYWDNTNKRLTTTSAGNTLAGYAATAAGNGDTTVNLHLNA